MKFYNVDIVGKMWLQRLPNEPVWVAADEGRLLYDAGENVAYLANNSDFVEVWTAGNDGAGSGLDADLLDSQEGSYYQNATNLTSGTLLAGRLSGTYDIDIKGDVKSDNGVVCLVNGATPGASTYTGTAEAAKYS